MTRPTPEELTKSQTTNVKLACFGFADQLRRTFEQSPELLKAFEPEWEAAIQKFLDDFGSAA